jgi:hypothetical protein
MSTTRLRSAFGDIHDLLEQFPQLLVLAVETAHVGGEASLVVEMFPGDLMSGLSGELAQERTQAAGIALPKWMNRVHLGVVVSQRPKKV